MPLSCIVSETWRYIGRKSPIVTYPTSIWRPIEGDHVGISPRSWLEKTKVHSLSYGVFFVTLSLAVLVQYRHGQADRRTDRHTTTAYTALA